jgi:hypothetical protein
MIRRKATTLLFALTAVALPGVAHAESGWVSGTWTFWNKNGNYCPTSRSCTGAHYTQAQYDTTQPLRKIEVFIENDTAGIIGRGVTDSSGNYNIQWSYNGTLPNKDKTSVWVRPYHGDGRFVVHYTNGTYPNNWTPYFTISAGTTESSPQNRGSWCVGACTSASPDPYYNVYWAAERAWTRRLATSGWFDAYLTDTEYRGFQDDIPDFKGNCPTSCASNNTIQLDDSAGYKPMSRAIHELGHIVIENSQDWKPTDECYEKNGDGGWNRTEDEWACSGFEEAFATFLADSTIYNSTATAPHSCNSSSACSANTYNIETSNGSSCATGESGWPLSHERYLWDVFDQVDDGETVTEASPDRWWRMYRIYQHYPAGTGAYAADEHWNSSKTALDDKDGRGSYSYRRNYSSFYSFDVSSVRSHNCSPP